MGCDVIVDEDCEFTIIVKNEPNRTSEILHIQCKKGDRLYFDYWSEPAGATHDR